MDRESYELYKLAESNVGRVYMEVYHPNIQLFFRVGSVGDITLTNEGKLIEIIYHVYYFKTPNNDFIGSREISHKHLTKNCTEVNKQLVKTLYE